MYGKLWRRIAFTLAALVVVRLGLAIPLPGINPEIWMQIFRRQEGGLLGNANMLSGGGLRTLSILALSITPYVTAAVLVQLFTMVSRRLHGLAEVGESGRRTIAFYVRCGAVLLAALQAYGIAVGLGGIAGVVSYPPLVFRLSTVLTLVAGTLFLVWLAEQITARGICNGLALLLIAGFLAEGPPNLARVLEAARMDILAGWKLIAVAVMAVAFTAVVITVERARRLVWVRFAEREVGDRRIGRQSVELTFKLNPGGIVPALVASWVLLIVIVAAQLVSSGLGLRGLGDLLDSLAPGRPLYLALSAVIIILFAFVYTAFLHDPARLARQLQTLGGAVAELVPGTPTADYLDDTLTRVTALGAVYLAAIMLLPIVLAEWLGLPFAIGGTSLLVLVCLTLDIEEQVRALLSELR
ncbi:MAG TPA: preprotein translocase subunit SecY [Xanthobacteraceae bacterium]|jgi:preprotein translocase subunit SecY